MLTDEGTKAQELEKHTQKVFVTDLDMKTGSLALKLLC